MLRDLLASRAILAGLVFFVLVVGGSLFYSWHVQRTTAAESTRTNAMLQQFKHQNQIPSAQDTIDPSTIDFEHAETPLETSEVQMSDDTDRSSIDEASEFADVTDAFLPDDFVSEESPAEDVPVSPYGFGPYPELPPEFPENYWDGLSKGHELIARVWMKLLEQGVDVTGGSIQNGLVYPNIRGTIYIEWDGVRTERVGTERYISRMMGDHDTIRRIRDLRDPDAYPLQSLKEKDIPAGITVVNYPDSGVDPYQFLDLKE